MEDPRFKDIKLNDPVTVTLPASVWVGFYGAYLATRWASWYASRIAEASQKAMLDPVYAKEMEAKDEAEREEQVGKLRHLFTGQLPETPPNIEDL